MNDEGPFTGEPADTRERILRATYLALREHGYAGLSLQRIADEAELSKSSVYHFYDDKDDLLLAFLDFMLERFREGFSFAASGDPEADLRVFLRHAILGEPPTWRSAPPAETTPFGPHVELRAQAVTKDAYRERFSAYDETFASQLATTIEGGIEAGVFREVDPEAFAELLLSLMMGAIVRRATIETFDDEAILAEVDAVLEAYLLVEE